MYTCPDMRYLLWGGRPSKRNLITLAAVAIVLPTGALAFMQYQSLVDLESKTRIAIEENLRQTLQSIARNAQGDMQTLARETLGPLGSMSRSPEDLKHVLGRASELHPEVDQFFVFSTCSCKVENRFALLYSSGALRRVSGPQLGTDADVGRVLDAYRSSLALRPPAESTREFLFWQQSCSLPNEASHSFFYVFYPLKNTDVAGLILNPQYVRKEYLERLIPGLLRGSDTKASASGLAVGVFDEKENQVYTNASGIKNYQVKMAFAPVFPNWDLAAAYRGSSIEGVARASFEKSLLLTAFVLCLLLLGIILTLRAASREMSLAAAKSSFVSNVSHELRTPISIVRTTAELALETQLTRESAASFQSILEESERMTALVESLLTLARADSGSGLSDPIVVYNDQIGRFIVGDQDVNFNTHVSTFDIAVSKTSSPSTLSTTSFPPPTISVIWPYAIQPIKLIATTQKTGFVISRIARIISDKTPRRAYEKGHKSKNDNVKTQASRRDSD